MLMGSDWSVCQNLNICNMFWMNHIQMSQSVVERWQLGGELRVLLGLWLVIGVCSLSEIGSGMNHCSCLLLCMVKRII